MLPARARSLGKGPWERISQQLLPINGLELVHPRARPEGRCLDIEHRPVSPVAVEKVKAGQSSSTQAVLAISVTPKQQARGDRKCRFVPAFRPPPNGRTLP